MGGHAPQAPGNGVRPRLQSGASARPLNFTVRWQRGVRRTFHLRYSCRGRHGGDLAKHYWRVWNRTRGLRLREKLRGDGASFWCDGVPRDAT